MPQAQTQVLGSEIYFMAKLIALHGKHGEGKFAIVDDEDFERLNKYRWAAQHNPFYAFRSVWRNGRSFGIFMHREIMNAPDKVMIDHRNHDGLDNRKSNLRLCSSAQNQANRRKGNGTSKYKGVHFNTRNSRWVAKLMYKQKEYYLGVFKDETKAAKAYDAKARELFGEFAKTNFQI
jgi:hypothetical protein